MNTMPNRVEQARLGTALEKPERDGGGKCGGLKKGERRDWKFSAA